MCGRGSRKFEGKEYFTIYDFGGNHDRHGLWNQPREWSLEEKKKKKVKVFHRSKAVQIAKRCWPSAQKFVNFVNTIFRYWEKKFQKVF